MTRLEHRAREERGAAALLAVAMTGVLMFVSSALGLASGLFVAHRRAQAAADLAALAGAAAAARGQPACVATDEVARRNGARVEECSVDGDTVSVRVVVAGPGWRGLQADLDASARAGPG